MCEQNHAVIFLPEQYGQSAILNLPTGVVDFLRKEAGTNVVDAAATGASIAVPRTNDEVKWLRAASDMLGMLTGTGAMQMRALKGISWIPFEIDKNRQHYF